MGVLIVIIIIIIAAFFLLVVPAMAIYAFARTRTYDREIGRTGNLTTHVFALEARIRQLESRLTETPGPAAPPADPRLARPAATAESAPVHPPPAAAAPVFVPSPPAPIAPEPAGVPPPVVVLAPEGIAPRRQTLDWESLIAGRWLNVIGIAAMLLAVAFFLAYAFENQWIGPAGRVALGLFAGVALLAWSDRLFVRGYGYFAEGIAGLGGGILYLSIYAAWAYYALLPQPAAFGGMVAVTAALMLLAAGRRAERIALVGLAGGFAAPLLLSTGTSEQVVLFAYVAALDMGAFALGRFRQWRFVDPVAFAGTQLLFWLWYAAYWSPEALLTTAAFATLFFVLFAVAAFDRLRLTGGRAPLHLALLLSNALAYLVALRALLWPTHRWTLTVAVLGLAAAHLLLARMARGEHTAGAPLLRTASAGLALVFATLAIPVRLDGSWVTIAWAIEGAVLVWSGFTARVQYLRGAGLVLLAIAVLRLGTIPLAGTDRFVINPRFLTMVTVGLCLVAAVWFAWRRRGEYVPGEGLLYAGAAVTANFLLLWALTADVWELVGRFDRPLGLGPASLRQLAIPLTWVAYGGALVMAGFVRELPPARWMGLPIVGAAVGAMLVQQTRMEAVVLNPRFGVYLVALAALVAIGWLARRAVSMGDPERLIYRAMPVVVSLVLLVALSHEVWDLVALVRTAGDVGYARSMGLSILWAAFAAALIGVGVRRAEPSLRWMALLLFGIVVVKVFFFDLSVLDRGYRILSFFVLGVLLLGVSFLYTRRLAAARGGDTA